MNKNYMGMGMAIFLLFLKYHTIIHFYIIINYLIYILLNVLNNNIKKFLMI